MFLLEKKPREKNSMFYFICKLLTEVENALLKQSSGVRNTIMLGQSIEKHYGNERSNSVTNQKAQNQSVYIFNISIIV